MQLELDLWEPAPEPPPLLPCAFCGEESPNRFVADINHGQIGDRLCTKAYLLLNHCSAIVKRFSGDPNYPSWNCHADGCEKHYHGEYSKKPIHECARREYDQKRAWLLGIGVPEIDIPVLPDGGPAQGKDL